MCNWIQMKNANEVMAELSVTKQTLKLLLVFSVYLLPGTKQKLSILNSFDLSNLDKTAPLPLASPALETLLTDLCELCWMRPKDSCTCRLVCLQGRRATPAPFRALMFRVIATEKNNLLLFRFHCQLISSDIVPKRITMEY